MGSNELPTNETIDNKKAAPTQRPEPVTMQRAEIEEPGDD